VDEMLRSIFTKTLYDQRRSLVWWALALVWVVLVYAGGYRQYVEAGLVTNKVPEFVGAIMGSTDFSSAAGYLTAVIFTLLGPVIVVLFATFTGARAIAGDEEAGMLDILLASPMSRTRVVLERTGALVAAVAWLGLIVWVAVSAAAAFSDMGLGLDRIAAAAVGLALLGIIFGMVTLATGALTGSRPLALGVTAAAALGSFLVNNLAPQVESLEQAQKLSPFYYYLGGDPLRSGFDLPKLGVLVLIVVALVALAIWGLGRRDVAV